MRRFSGAIAVMLLGAGCGSSAPYTLTSAALNSGLALGASAYERSAGGCYAICTAGTVCNPNTGYCERAPLPRCTRGAPGCDPVTREALDLEQLVQQPSGAIGKSIGVSAETGRAPSPPPTAGPPQGAPGSTSR